MLTAARPRLPGQARVKISQDPVADSTDLYAFVSPDRKDTVTLIANYVPLQEPDGGPNFYEFGDDVLYEIHIDNSGDGHPDITYQFRFETRLRDKETFLYNTGPITSLGSPAWNRRQFFSVHRKKGHHAPEVLGRHLACPPCNIGPLSTPRYAHLAEAAVHDLAGGVKVFAGQRAEGFYVDLARSSTWATSGRSSSCTTSSACTCSASPARA